MANQLISSVIVYQETDFCLPGSNNVAVLRIEVTSDGADSPATCNRFIFQNASDDAGLGYAAATTGKLYFGGQDSVFTNASQIGGTVTSPGVGNNTITVSPAQTLEATAVGTINYFWLVMDCNNAAELCTGSYLDATPVSMRFTDSLATTNYIYGVGMTGTITGNVPIQAPEIISPAADASTVCGVINFSWDPGNYGSGLEFDVYLTTDPTPDTVALTTQEVSVNNINLGIPSLLPSTTYYWTVLKAGYDIAPCTVYSFTTDDNLVNITTDPVSITVVEGESATFTVVGDDIVSYQWLFEGDVISGATSSTLTIDPVSMSDIGDYSCVCTNACSEETSAVAYLDVTMAEQEYINNNQDDLVMIKCCYADYAYQYAKNISKGKDDCKFLHNLYKMYLIKKTMDCIDLHCISEEEYDTMLEKYKDLCRCRTCDQNEVYLDTL